MSVRSRGIRLFNSDCIKQMRETPDEFVTAVITDPPYGMNFQSNRSKNGPRHQKVQGDEKINDRWLKEAFRVLQDGGCLLSFCNWETSCEWAEAIKEVGFQIKSQVIWNRLHHGMGDLKGAFAPQHDIVWYACKGRRVFINGRPKSIIESKRPSPKQDYGHPTCKPVDLMENLIQSVQSRDKEIILDPFMGSGSTGVASRKLGHSFIGIEIEDSYYKTAVERINAKDGNFD